MKRYRLTLVPTFLCLFLIYIYPLNTCMSASENEDEAGQAPARRIFIHIHSGITTYPVRKVLGMIITKSGEKGVYTIKGNGMLEDNSVWNMDLTFFDEKGNEVKSLKWQYLREQGILTPRNKEAEDFSFPFSNYLLRTTINMGLGMIEGQGVSPKTTDGNAERLADNQWTLNITGLTDNGERFIQEWSYDSKEGVLSPIQFDH